MDAEWYIARGDSSHALEGAESCVGMIGTWKKLARRHRAMAAIARKAKYMAVARECLKDAKRYDGLARREVKKVREYLYDAEWAMGVKAGTRKAPKS